MKPLPSCPSLRLATLSIVGAVCALAAPTLAQIETGDSTPVLPSKLVNTDRRSLDGATTISPLPAPRGGVCDAFDVQTECQTPAFTAAYNITAFGTADAISARVPVSSLCVQGFYFNNIPVPDHWVVTVYADAGGVPGIPIDTFTQGVDLIVNGPVGVGATFADRDVQEWNLVLARPVNHAGACLWYELRNRSTGDQVFQLDGNGSNGNHHAAQDFSQNGVYEAEELLPDDLNICINGGFADNAPCFIDPCDGHVPPNDECANATVLGIGPNAGTTRCANADTAPTCSGVRMSPSVWYTLIGTGHTMTVDLCSAPQFDTAMEVYCGGCDSLVCAGGNDDFCVRQSSVTLCTAPGTPYLVLVHGFGDVRGDFTLTLTDSGIPCSTPPTCTACTGIVVPPGTTPEAEPCGASFNNGCNATPHAFEPIVGNRTIAGTSFASGGMRDVDWFTVTAPASGIVTATVAADFNGLGLIIDLGTPIDDSCQTRIVLAQTNFVACGTGQLVAHKLTPGNTYAIVVVPAVRDGVPCSAYVLTVDQGDPRVVCGDFNRDGAVNSQDFFEFLAAFFAQAPAADFNVDGAVNSQDFFDFLAALFAGC